jgi:exonuclease SbcC
MQIVALELENVKSYAHARFAFTPGVNAIVGHNGAGKSTILEAIGFALFDALPYTTQEFVREGARTGTIAVTFLSTFDERPYRVERRFGGSNAYAVHDDELRSKVCDGKSDVLAFVRRHTLADPSVDLTRLFNDALGVAQGALATAFAETPARRKPIFDALLQVDDYSAAADRLREPARRLRDQIVEAERTLAILTTRLEQLPTLTAQIARRTRDLAAAATKRAELETRLAANQSQLQALEKQRAQVEALTTQLARHEETVRSLDAQLRRAEQARSAAEEAAALVAARQPGHDAYLAAQRAQETLQVRAGERQTLLNKQSAADKELALIAARSAQLEQAQQEAIAAEAMVQELAAAVARQNTLTEEVSAREHAQSQLADAEHRGVATAAQRQKLADRHAKAIAGRERALLVEQQGQTLNRQLAELRATLDQAREEVARTQAELAALEEQSSALRDIDTPLCPICEQPLTAEHRSEMLARNAARATDLRRALAAAQNGAAAHQQEISTLEEERTRLQREWTQLPRENELTDAAQALAEADVELARGAAERQALAAQVGGLDALRQALAGLHDPRSRSAVASARAAQRPQIETQLAQTQTQQTEAQRQIAAIEQALAALGDLDEALAENSAQLRLHNEAYQAVLTNRQTAAALPRAVAEVAEIAQTLEAAHAASAITRAELKVATQQFDLANYQQVLLDDRAMREELGSLSASIRLLHEAQTQDEAHLQTLHDDQARQQRLEQERQRLTRQDEALETIRVMIKQAGPFVTQALVRQVSEGAATIFGELMRDHSRVLEWNEDYGIRLTAGGAMRTFRQLSGGEQMSAALAVRLALVREMSSINVAFFDEPTANLDGVRREALANQIMTVRGFNQLFVISHDDTFEQATQNLIRVTRHGNTTAIGDTAE